MKETKIAKENVLITLLKEKEVPNWVWISGYIIMVFCGVLIGRFT